MFRVFVTSRCICVDDLDILVYPLLCCSPKITALFGASDQSRNCFLGLTDSPRSFIEERPCSLFARLKEEEESNEVTLSVSRSLTLLLLFLFSFGSGQLGQDTHETDEGPR